MQAFQKKALPDIVFLDIDMKEHNGLKVAKAIKEKSPDTEIIFATGYPEYALKALEIKPLSYLVKPFGPDNIREVIERYHEKLKKTRSEQYLKSLIEERSGYKKIKFPIKGGFVFIDPNDIMLFKGEGLFSRVYLKDGENDLIRMSPSMLFKTIDLSSVFKTNRTVYVNINYLIKIERKNRICTVGYGKNIHTVKIVHTNIVQFEKIMISFSDEQSE